ncbi:N-acetylglucosamine kinase [Streptomyces sp. NPDC090077]|uniref:N-acetylglucosamine kinase n=1 Tax=Streptomyces sp. NPDC090077 TaxID=3365938 RepID=UPI003824581D
MTRTTLVLGIDAGGSALRVAVAEADGGPPLATASAGAGNARSVPEPVLEERLAHAVGEVLTAGRAARVRCVVAGFAGAGITGGAAGADDAGRGRAQRALHAALARHGVRGARVHVLADSEVAFAAAPGTPPDGLVLVAGTGAAAVRIRGHRLAAAADGCGWLTGDDGSGFWIAREAVRRALRALDGRGPDTVLLPRLAAAFTTGPTAEPTPGPTGPPDATPSGPHPGPHSASPSGPPGAAPTASPSSPHPGPPSGPPTGPDPAALRQVLIDGARAAAEPARLARLCPVVFGAAADGDAVAGRILDEAADLLIESAAALGPRRGEPLVTVGGLIGPRGPLLDRLAVRLSGWDLTPHPVPDGLPGALALARSGALTQAVS